MIPDTGEFARSRAWMIAVPRKNAKGEADIRSCLTEIRPGMRSASDCSMSLMGSCDFERGFHSACAARGHLSRRAFPCLCFSTLDKFAKVSIVVHRAGAQADVNTEANSRGETR